MGDLFGDVLTLGFWVNLAVAAGAAAITRWLLSKRPVLQKLLLRYAAPVTDRIFLAYSAFVIAAALSVVVLLNDAEMLALWQSQGWRPNPVWAGMLRSFELRLFYLILPVVSLGLPCMVVLAGRLHKAPDWVRYLSVIMVPALAIADYLALAKYALVPADIVLSAWPVWTTILIEPAMFVGIPGCLIGVALMATDTLFPTWKRN